MPDFSLERSALKRGYQIIAGLDEAGRGALFGPVVSAAVVFSPALIQESHPGRDWMKDINDSKLLSPKKRRYLCRHILKHAAAVGWGLATHEEIDRQNIHWASLESMRRAISRLSTEPDFLLVDGLA